MIHVTLIDYKKLYEDSLREIKDLTDEKAAIETLLETVKTAHNASVVKMHDEAVFFDAEIDAYNERLDSIADKLGGEGTIEERIDLKNATMTVLKETNRLLTDKIATLESKIRYMAEERVDPQIVVDDSMGMKYDELSQMYRNAMEHITTLEDKLANIITICTNE